MKISILKLFKFNTKIIFFCCLCSGSYPNTCFLFFHTIKDWTINFSKKKKKNYSDKKIIFFLYMIKSLYEGWFSIFILCGEEHQLLMDDVVWYHLVNFFQFLDTIAFFSLLSFVSFKNEIVFV